MTKDKIGKLLIVFGFYLFNTTLLNNLDFSLKTSLLISVGLGLLVYGILILIELKQNKNDSKIDEKTM